MKQVVQDRRSGGIAILDAPEPRGGPKSVRIHTLASLVSGGTEKISIEFSGLRLLGAARARPELTLRAIDLSRTGGLGPTIKAVRVSL